MANENSRLQVHREHHEMVPVWFFIGILLLFYGIVILGAGLLEYHHLPAVVLARYHANVWGGTLLILIGFPFTARFYPHRNRMGSKSAILTKKNAREGDNLAHTESVSTGRDRWPAV